jgi:hypothetical protein
MPELPEVRWSYDASVQLNRLLPNEQDAITLVDTLKTLQKYESLGQQIPFRQFADECRTVFSGRFILVFQRLADFINILAVYLRSGYRID